MTDINTDKDDIKYQITPKGYFMLKVLEYSQYILEKTNDGKIIDEDESYDLLTDLWHKFEAFCIKSGREINSSYVALVFDGHGGEIIGVEKNGTV